MKIPVKPPSTHELVAKLLAAEPERLSKVVFGQSGIAPGGKYRHWDTLRHLAPPSGLTAEEWWLSIKSARQKSYQKLPLRSVAGKSFVYTIPGVAHEMLHRIDTDAAGNIAAPEQVTNPHTRDTYLFKTLVEEAITSSQLEGASTTRKVAKEMIQTGRKPRNRSEQMIVNNYEAMLFVRRFIRQPLTPQIVCELQRILTHNTLDDTGGAGRFRREDEVIHVEDEVGTTLHIPPTASELEKRMRQMCAFANETQSAEFVHPVIRAIMLHFWLAYDHPFVDGNGRTARALFYWSMASQGYWLCEFLSISRILKKARARYSRSFLYTETDDNDATYFILSQLRVITAAIDELYGFLRRKAEQLRETESLINSPTIRDRLNYRQLALLNHALEKTQALYTVESHRRSHGVSYATSRSDLLELSRLGLLEMRKSGRAFSFHAPEKLRQQLTRMSGGPRHQRV